MGGEKCNKRVRVRKQPGSPPRGRGKAAIERVWKQWLGITPAWAGKSNCRFTFFAFWEDHPRVGGEKIISQRHGVPASGSPPRGRGKGRRRCISLLTAGITPAWAGKSTAAKHCASGIRDHPRVGGEKDEPSADQTAEQGSPPRGRGKAPLAAVRQSAVRITPAWAGKRLKRSHRSGIFISGPIPFHSVLHRPAGSGGSRAGRDGSPAGQPQNTGPA